MPGITVDGLDFFAVYEAAGEVIKRAREGAGPTLLECKNVRFFGHFEGDAQTYKAPGENEYNRANNDCLKLFRQKVSEAGVISTAELDAIDAEVAQLIDEAVAEAIAAPQPTPDRLTADVYVNY
jgi:pyruvate dehydrogenase E1 component alpha subunit